MRRKCTCELCMTLCERIYAIVFCNADVPFIAIENRVIFNTHIVGTINQQYLHANEESKIYWACDSCRRQIINTISTLIEMVE
jgi:hypothetical protein